jgi:para-nitrobenzyl esterase
MISTPSGQLRGVERSDGTTAYLGIRYARAARGAVAVPEPAWAEAVTAQAHGPICPQIPGVLEQGMGLDSPMDEDCLYLSVHVPPGVTPADAQPVLVWIHGGAFETGAGSAPWYDGGSLAARYGMVVVTINYRLGLLGFWRDRNLGLLDQIEALRWVHRHIDSFGGDAQRVTLLGESAGGCSVLALLASPHTAGLVHGAWAMSPSIGQMRTRKRADEVAAQLLALAGVATEEDLFALDLPALLEVQRRAVSDTDRAFDTFAPTVGGAGLPSDVIESIALSPVPLVLGTCADEHRLWAAFDPAFAAMEHDEVMRRLGLLFGDRSPAVLADYEQHRPACTPGQLMSAVLTDDAFRSRTVAVAEARVAAGQPTWMYWFTWASPAFGGVLGACHGLDIPFAFHQLDAPGVTLFTGDGADRAQVAEAYAGALAELVATSQVSWPLYDQDRRATWQIDVPTRIVDDPEPRLRAWWVGRDIINGVRASGGAA